MTLILDRLRTIIYKVQLILLTTMELTITWCYALFSMGVITFLGSERAANRREGLVKRVREREISVVQR